MNRHFLTPWIPLLCLAALPAVAAAQSVAIFPDEYAAVPDGPFSSPNLPFAQGTSRVLCLYQAIDLQIPSGHQITRLGFREDRQFTQVDVGVVLQLEIRMGYTTMTETTMSTTFDSNYSGAPVTVFGPALYTPPTLRSVGAPLPNGQLFIDLTTPFSYVPNGKNLLVEYRIFGAANGGQAFNYRLDRADYYSPTTLGAAGCPHSGGPTPSLTVDPVRPGLTYNARITTGPANAPAFLVLNIGNSLVAPYSLGAVFSGISPLCTGQMPLTGSQLLSGLSAGSGTMTWSFPIPNNPVFADLRISSQAMFLDFFSPGTVVVSNGAELLTGSRPRTAILAASGVPSTLTTGTLQQFYCPVAFFAHQ